MKRKSSQTGRIAWALAAVLLFLGLEPAEAQGSRPAAVVIAASAPASSASAVAPAVASSASAPDATTAQIDAVLTRLDALKQAVDAAKPAAPNRWDDAKSVFLNILSNRLDAKLFGDGKEKAGLAAQFAAALALAVAVIRLITAVALLNPATPPTPWGRFKAWALQSAIVRRVNVAIGLLAVAFTATALYVVLSARSMSDGEERFAGLRTDLAACREDLARQRDSMSSRTAATPLSDRFLTAFEQHGKACVAAAGAASGALANIEQQLSGIDGRLMGRCITPTSAASAPPAADLDGLRQDARACVTASQSAAARLAELERQSRAYVEAAESAKAMLEKMQPSIAFIEDKQPSMAAKILTFVAWFCLLAAAAYLVIKRLTD